MSTALFPQTDRWTRDADGLGFAAHSWRALGCSVRVVVVDPTRIGPAVAAVTRVLDEVDLAASRFRPDSELSQLNASGGSRVAISPLFATLLRVGLDAAAWTGGLVDPTVGAALTHLGYDRTFSLVPADGAAISLVPLPAPGFGLVELDLEGTWARVPSGVRVDLGATAKGVAADLAAKAAAEECGTGVLVSLGGDMRLSGPVPPDGWPVEVCDVTDHVDDGPRQTIALHAGALATSGIRGRRWRRGGSELHHLLDPRLGLPARGPWRTASVTASTCALANTASTAAIILGTRAAGWLGERGFSARLVTHDGTVTYVGAWPRAEGQS